MKLDENQRKAVEHFEGPALVVAGPGSGKTTIIIERILNLVHKHNVDPENILAIAFTKAAAGEMRDRLRKSDLEGGEPRTSTLHAFGNDLITKHYKEAGLDNEPGSEDIWGDKKIQNVIRCEKDKLDRETREAIVYIYRIEDRTSHQCYIGQTTNPDRRKKEHFSNSSNRGLREAIQQKGREVFDFKVIQKVNGSRAYPREKYWIDYYRNRSVVNLVHGMEQVAGERSDALVVIYKIQSRTDSTAYIGYTTNPESVRKIIESGDERFTFEIIHTEVPWAKAAAHIANEIEKHKNWVVFNRQDPEKARYSNQLLIEMFCKYFKVPYDEVLESPEKFENLTDKFDNLKKEVIEREKRQTVTGVFKPIEIADPILRAFAKRYEDTKEKAEALDYLDMLILSANMLEKNPDLHSEYQEKYRYVFVDEFQDISPLDFRLIDLFSENLFAVGDDDQAIYGFRGGDSEIMQKFREKEDVTVYKVTRNYRSSPTIVRHAKTLIEHNRRRISKNLYAHNFTEIPVKFLPTAQKTAKVNETLLGELSDLQTSDVNEVGVLARNWKGEINDIQEILDFSELQEQGFEIEGDPHEKNKTKVLRYGNKKVEILTIHTAKGREWEKVILLVNTIYDSLPHDRNDLTEERRLFYVAATRAKQELVVLDGGNCEFVPEFQNVPHIWIPDQLDKIVEKYLDRLIFAFQNKYQLTSIDQGFIKQEMVQYLTELDNEVVNKIASLTTLDGATAVKIGRYADYVIGKEKIHLCTDVFQGFWRRMWEVVEQARNMPNPQI